MQNSAAYSSVFSGPSSLSSPSKAVNLSHIPSLGVLSKQNDLLTDFCTVQHSDQTMVRTLARDKSCGQKKEHLEMVP